MFNEGQRDSGTWRNSVFRYGSLSIALHWLMLLLIAAVYTCIELRELFPKELPLIVLFRQISALEKESSQL